MAIDDCKTDAVTGTASSLEHIEDDIENAMEQDIPVIELEHSLLEEYQQPEGREYSGSLVQTMSTDRSEIDVDQLHEELHPHASEVFILDEEMGEEIPQAKLVMDNSDTESTGGCSDSCCEGLSDLSHADEEALRPEFIGVMIAPSQHQVQQPSSGQQRQLPMIGIRFSPEGGGRIARIVPGSLLSNTPLRPGDTIVSINGKHCQGMTSKQIAARIQQQVMYTTLKNKGPKSGSKQSDGFYLRMVAQNDSDKAVSHVVESMITKLSPDDSLGVSLALSSGQVRITDIVPCGIVERGSLFNVGDTLLRVNGVSCSGLSPHAIVDILREAPQHVTILARSRVNTAVVVAQVSRRQLDWKAKVNRTGQPILMDMNYNRHRDIITAAAVEEDRRMIWKRVVFVIFVIVFIVLTIVISKRDTSKQEDRIDPYEEWISRRYENDDDLTTP